MLKKIVIIASLSTVIMQGSEYVLETKTQIDWVIENSKLKVTKTKLEYVTNYVDMPQWKEYPQPATEHTITDDHAIIKPNGFHDYSERQDSLEYLIVDRNAKAYINSLKKPLTIYAASGSKIYDAGSNAKVIDIDFEGSYYEPDCLYLKDRGSYYARALVLGFGSVAVASVIGLIATAIILGCQKSHNQLK